MHGLLHVMTLNRLSHNKEGHCPYNCYRTKLTDREWELAFAEWWNNWQ